MHVVMVSGARVPVYGYGGTERVLWDLSRGLTIRGHRVSILAPPGSHCPFAQVLPLDRKAPVAPQIPLGVDLVHFHYHPDVDLDEGFPFPYVLTEHGNPRRITVRPLNTVFVSRDHARRYHSDQFVPNGLDWDAYGPADLTVARGHFHFLAKATRRAKNIGGAIAVAQEAGVDLAVLGGRRLSVWKGFRLTLSPRVRFHGMVGGTRKNTLLNHSRGLIFPVRWAEPFGLALIESLFFGCPVFGTPYGSLTELIGPDVGFLSTSKRELAEAIRSLHFDPRRCHDYARDTFNASVMTDAYLDRYETVLNGHALNATRPYVGGLSSGLLPWHE